ncbi:hypothetical protein EDB83DRAFT_2652336 [Lactarius deliciosus]|nr:hypothetical protein EDB83DRAFT_2652336 [Lactarius deliciosus]
MTREQKAPYERLQAEAKQKWETEKRAYDERRGIVATTKPAVHKAVVAPVEEPVHRNSSPGTKLARKLSESNDSSSDTSPSDKSEGEGDGAGGNSDEDGTKMRRMMSAPPPSSPPTVNPDRRQLPDGWITRWDDNYHAWYYVDTRAQPPRSSWAHPLGAAPSSPQPSTTYAPPSNPPPNRAYNSGGPSFPGGYPQGYGYPAQTGMAPGGWQQAQQPVYAQPQQPPSTWWTGRWWYGMGGLALAAGGGYWGALLANAFEDHDRDDYNEGFQDGQDDNYDGGDF